MAEQQRVILYGDTLILAGVQASLGAAPNLEIIPLNGSLAELAESLHDLQPAAVIFDLDSVQPGLPAAILQQPGLMLIGVDPSSSRLVVLSSLQERAMGAADVVGVIHRKSVKSEEIERRNKP